jgi:hypothetical protein
MLEGSDSIDMEFKNPIYGAKPKKPNSNSFNLQFKHDIEEEYFNKIDIFFKMYSKNSLFSLKNISIFCENFGKENQQAEELKSSVAAATDLFKEFDAKNDETIDYESFILFAKKFSR